MSKQYKVVEGSQSAHCCFSATVVDTHNPVMIGGEHYNNQYEEICECFSVKEAELIAKALNQRAELLEALKEAKAALEWCVEQGGGPICEHESGGVVCFCKENKAINLADVAITKAEAAE